MSNEAQIDVSTKSGNVDRLPLDPTGRDVIHNSSPTLIDVGERVFLKGYTFRVRKKTSGGDLVLRRVHG